ncbi:MAG: ATP-binding cassette domain-containing protein [Ignavibacteria bacterium]|jgi:ATP-binding cassette subfamily B protein|nr:ATP-binding cassette domain-containing protein [Ignavibacteria bacterium]MCU7499920.1 ATP-binding cassette domain-containing protein [Ignavibacteria bacterium]MCU7511481.1 ATP-binding cassette domain-containing protein [Ignavibacteria bacterium]MCU7519478.1 ATP-binding cassette domain-containing protein [Ignavibacteria bacterium]MCU7524044.1 ATP-binding cassette domain-containing protein [Ignavibacteria bacterium]
MYYKEDEIIERLNSVSLFSGLTAEDMELLSGNTTTRKLSLGEELYQEGDEQNTFISVISGSLRLKKKIDDRLRSIGKLNEGDYTGEMSFVKAARWDYSISSADETLVFEVNARMPEMAPIAEKLKRSIASSELKKVLTSIVAVKKIDETWLNELSESVWVSRYEEGEAIFSQDEMNNSLYYVVSGSFEIYRNMVEGKFLVGLAQKGDFAGEYGAISDRKQGYEALAKTASTVLEIPHRYVEEIFALNGALRDAFLDKINSYENEERRQRELTSHNSSENEDEFPSFDEGKKIKKFPWLRQHDEMDCGAACLTMVSKYYGHKLSMGMVREMANVSVAGASMAAVCKAGENLGYRARGLKLTYPSLKDVNLPAILHWQGYHWIVLFKISREFVWVADPAIGIRKITHSEFRKSWTGYAIELEPTERLNELKPAKNPIFRYINYLKPMKMFLIEVFIGALILNVLGLASPLFIQSILDNVIVYKNTSLLNMMLMGMVLVAFFSTLTSSAQQFIIATISAKLDLRMLAEFFKYTLSLPMSYFYNRKLGDTITRFGENSKIRAILTDASISTVLNVIMLIIYLQMMFLYSVTLSLVVLAFIPFFIALTFVFTPIFKRISNEQFMVSSDQSSYLIEAIHGIETIKANGTEWNVRNRWEESFLKSVNLSFKSQKLGLVSGVISQTLNTASTVAILWVGSNQVINGSMSIGQLMAFNALIGSVMGPIMSIVGLWDNYQSVSVAMDRLNDVFECEPEEKPPVAGVEVKHEMAHCEGRIEFKDLQFRYGSEDSPLVLKSINLKVEPGQVVAFVGKSGCGKSTLIKTIPGFIMPTGGSLMIDGVDIKNINLLSLRRNIGMVLQESFLFSGTVMENIALGDINPDEKRVREAAEMAAAHEFIMQLPAGYKTIVGERGLAVSGGQKQRICIARSLYRNPKIFIFDEATSALDAESEKRIQENLNNILVNRTAFIIAHRLSTVRNADIICFLGDGLVLEKGTHDELIKQRGFYYAMAKDQLGAE